MILCNVTMKHWWRVVILVEKYGRTIFLPKQIIGDRASRPAFQICLHILSSHQLMMLMNMFQVTSKQFQGVTILSNLLFMACMSFMSTYLGSLQKNKSNETSFINMQDVSIFRSVYFQTCYIWQHSHICYLYFVFHIYIFQVYCSLRRVYIQWFLFVVISWFLVISG